MHALRLVLGTLLLAALAGPSAAAWYGTPPGTMRLEAVNDDYLWANLTWSGGKGVLSWSDTYTTDPLAGGTAGGEEFSGAIPVSAYVNSSRLLQADLLLKEVPLACSGHEVSIWVDGTLLGGSVDGQDFSQKPPPPTGFTLCRYRFGAELAHIPAGAVVTFRITYVNGRSPDQYGAGEGQNSVIRIPIFQPEDAIYRMPDIVPRQRPNPSQGVQDTVRQLPPDAAAPALLVPALGLLALPSRAVRARRAVLLFLALLTGAMAGCLGGGGTRATNAPGDEPGLTQGSSTVDYQEPGDTGLANESVGSIVGQVQDPYFFPVTGALVLLLGTPQSTATDVNGLFSFKHLKPGPYTVRVDRETFAGTEVQVDVKPNRITRLDVTLAYESGLAADERPHRHDYWQEKTSKTVLEGPIVDNCDAQDCFEDTAVFLRPVEGEIPNLILPGTNDVVVTLEFDPLTVHFQRVGLVVQANNDPSQYNRTLYMPRASGVPFHIRTTWEMTDVGHQRFSTWTFGVYSLSYDGTPNDPCHTGSGVIGGGIASYMALAGQCISKVDKATITIHRGALPLEPPHPDHWRGAENLRLEGNRITTSYYSSTDTVAFGGCLANAKNAEPAQTTGGRYLWIVLGGPTTPVPPDTGEIVLTAKLSRPTGASGAASYGWRLSYKPGDTPPVAYREYDDPSHTIGPAGTPSADRLTWTFRLAVKAGEEDGIYNKRSSWSLVMVPDDINAACLDRYANTSGRIDVTWSVDAFLAKG